MSNKICLIAPEFYHYHKSIADALIRKGDEVVFYPEMPNSFFHRFVKNLHKGWYEFLLEQYFNQILDDLKGREIDVFFFIRAEVVPVDFIKALKERFSCSRFIMYQWDSVLNNNYTRLLPYFDSVSTFDPVDSSNYSLNYLPLFYINNSGGSKDKPRDIDFLFVGSMNAQRIQQFRKFRKSLPSISELNVVISLYVTVPSFIKYLIKTFDFHSVREVSFRKVSIHQLNSMMKRAKNILDYASVNQSGISVRSFEALASGARLITNNATILEVFPELSSAVVVVDPECFSYDPIYSESLDQNILINCSKELEIDAWVDKVLAR